MITILLNDALHQLGIILKYRHFNWSNAPSRNISRTNFAFSRQNLSYRIGSCSDRISSPFSSVFWAFSVPKCLVKTFFFFSQIALVSRWIFSLQILSTASWQTNRLSHGMVLKILTQRGNRNWSKLRVGVWRLKAVGKMTQTNVNFINILGAAFSYKSDMARLSVLKVGVVYIFGKRKLGKNCL